MIRLVVSLYVFCNIGYRGVVSAIGVINEVLGLGFERIPAYTTVRYWMEKCGLDSYKRSPEMFKDKDYSVILDESMIMGAVKLLLTLVAPAKCEGPLKAGDVRVLGIDVASSHKGDDIKGRVMEDVGKMGRAPVAGLTDNGASVTYAMREAEITNLLDVGHSMGMFMERVYKDEADFRLLTKDLGLLAARENMRPNAFLTPPAQRAVQRFMNIDSWITWGKSMMDMWHKLTGEQRSMLKCVQQNASLIEELYEDNTCIKEMEKVLLHGGMSVENAAKCKETARRTFRYGNERQQKLYGMICGYLDREAAKLKGEGAYNISTDIIESLFGVYKSRKSRDKLNGVTGSVLFLPLYTELYSRGPGKYNFKKAAETHKIKDIKQWEKQNLPPSPTAKLRILKAS